jgi:hypothetical protein
MVLFILLSTFLDDKHKDKDFELHHSKLFLNSFCSQFPSSSSSVALQSLQGPCPPHTRGFVIIKTHGKTPLDEWSARRKGLYLHRKTQHRNTKTNIHASSGIRTHGPSNQPAKIYADRLLVNTVSICYPRFQTSVFCTLSKAWLPAVI